MSGQGVTSSVESRALALLGSGVNSEQVAAHLGVTPSRISQLLAQSEFASQVADLRFNSLQRHVERDQKLDAIEDKLADKVEKLLPLMMRPMEAIKAFQVINAAKRRGQVTTDHTTATQNIVQISMPTTVINKFTTNIHNQVVQAGGQDLLTIQSGSLLKQVQADNPLLVGVGNDEPTKRIAASDSNSPNLSQQKPDGAKQEESRQFTQADFVPVGR